MKKQLEELKIQIELFEIKQLEQVENFRLKFLSKKGTLNQFFEEFKTVPSEMKREVGALLNQVKQKAQQKWEEAQSKYHILQVSKLQPLRLQSHMHKGAAYPAT